MLGSASFKVPGVLIDTNVIRCATSGRVIHEKYVQELVWGDQSYNIPVAKPSLDDRVQRRPSSEARLKSEVRCLNDVISAAKSGKITLLVSDFVNFESWNMKNLADGRGRLQGAPFVRIKGPIEPQFVIGGPDSFKSSLTKPLLLSEDERFLELQQRCGAIRGEANRDENQLLDSYHFWTAECVNADYFLTLDFRLADRLHEQQDFQSSVEIVTPSELLERLPKSPFASMCARLCAKIRPPRNYGK